MLRHLAGQFPGTLVVDVGTHLGLSALALSTPHNTVLSLDIDNRRLAGLELPDNIEFRIANMVTDTQVFPLNASLALLDIDPHDGVQERAIVQQLLDREWHGLLVCDDIHLNASFLGLGLPATPPTDQRCDCFSSRHRDGLGALWSRA